MPESIKKMAVLIAITLSLVVDAVAEEPVVTSFANASEALDKLDVDFRMLYKCARLSKAVYNRPGTAQYNLKKEQLKRDYSYVLWDDFRFGVTLGADTQTLKMFLVLRHDESKEQFVCVAGSDGYADWKLNAEYPLKEELTGCGIVTHLQFRRLAEEIYDQRIKGVLKDDYATYVTGHSLGGAVAALVGMLIQRDGNCSLRRVYTFGQPKFTNISSSGLDNSSGIYVKREFPLLRVVNLGDPVPQLPPYSILKDWGAQTGLYAHLGDELLLTDQGKGHLKPFRDQDGSIISANIDKSDPDDFPETLSSISNSEQHRMNVYQQNLLPLSVAGQ